MAGGGKMRDPGNEVVEYLSLTYIVNSVDKTKLSCNTPTDAAPQFL